jgi:hypothetical protein
MKCATGDCPNAAKRSETGRPGQYCSEACKQKAYRLRQKGVTKLNDKGVTKLPDIQFYCGLNEKFWNHHPVQPGTHVCIAPVTGRSDPSLGKSKRETGVLIDPANVTQVLLDSGAFSDGIELLNGQVVRTHRLSYEHALQRQIAHAYKYHYASLVEALVSYDLLIDETWQDGERSKVRWSVDAAEYAVQETVQAAVFLSTQRRRIDRAFGHHVRLVLSAQGVDAEQYVRCARAIVKLMKPDDIFGLGGWCITGLMRHIMLPAAASILPGVFGVLQGASVKRVHVFGVIIPKLLGFLLHLCRMSGMELSTDSSGPCVEPARNGNWGYGSWTNPAYTVAPVLESCKVVDAQGEKAPTCLPDTVCRGLERCRHVQLTRDYLVHFGEREPDLVGPFPLPAGTTGDVHEARPDGSIEGGLSRDDITKCHGPILLT